MPKQLLLYLKHLKKRTKGFLLPYSSLTVKSTVGSKEDRKAIWDTSGKEHLGKVDFSQEARALSMLRAQPGPLGPYPLYIFQNKKKSRVQTKKTNYNSRQPPSANNVKNVRITFVDRFRECIEFIDGRNIKLDD